MAADHWDGIKFLRVPEYLRNTVATEEWRTDPERPGCLRLERRRTVREVIAQLNERLKWLDMQSDESDWHSLLGYEDGQSRDMEWPEGRIAVFAVTGSSEGHYMHLHVLKDGKETLIALAKTFRGFDFATIYAYTTARLLEV